jgi:hypothetical protein
MNSVQQDYFRDVVSDSVIGLFEDYGASCVPARSAPGTGDVDAEIGTIVGFHGGGIRGGLAFTAPADLIAATLPVPRRTEAGERQLRDWTVEVLNQLLGRFKNRLAASLDFAVGSIVCFRGSNIRLAFVPGKGGVALAFRVGGSSVEVYLDCEVVTDAGWEREHSVGIVPEGDVVIF